MIRNDEEILQFIKMVRFPGEPETSIDDRMSYEGALEYATHEIVGDPGLCEALFREAKLRAEKG